MPQSRQSRPLPEHDRARAYVRTTAVFSTIAAAIGIVTVATGDPEAGLTILAVALWSATGGLSAWRRGALRWEPHSLAAAILVVIFGLARQFGGSTAAAMFALPAVPAAMALYTSRRSVLTWAVICSLLPLAFALVPALTLPVAATPFSLTVARLIAPVGTIFLVTLTLLSYQSIVSQREASLQRAREAAEQARRAAETAQRVAEQAREEAEVANQAKSAFLATMSHEIRTPLTAVVGLAELLQARQTDPENAEQMNLLAGAGRTLLSLVDDVLDVSRIESGVLELESVPVELPALVDDVAGILRASAATRGTALTADHTGPGWIYGDPLRLRQILLNLVGNAVKFTEQGRITVTSRAAPRPDGQLDLTLTVSDTGAGIPEDRQAAVLQPFTQADQSTSRSHGGSGLGLSIVVRLVELMGGTLHLRSAPGVGTTLTISLTVPASAASQTGGHRTAAGSALRVLLAEDNPVNQRVVCAQLEHLGCTVLLATDGAEAVTRTLAAEPPVDVVFMDCQMPGTDGYQATRQLRAAGWSRPIVALTANATPQDRKACLAAGMDDFASKPVTLDELQRALDRASSPQCRAG